jgi:ribosomal protein S18 acetylase RimI-like enzyme
VRAIELASLRAWPAIEEVPYEGWTLRFSEGFSGRANSVQALGTSKLALRERVERCEAWYEDRGHPCRFRITAFTEPGLDDHLAGRGYARLSHTHVLARPTTGFAVEEPQAADLREAGLHDWLGIYATFNGVPATPAPMRRIIQRVGPGSLLGVLWADRPHRPVACGMAVLDGELLGLFDLVVDPGERKRGWGRELVRRLVAWGAGGGARRVYLQVTADNAAALALYRALGFESAYDYWYRVQPT